MSSPARCAGDCGGALAALACEACGTPYCSPVCQAQAWPAHEAACTGACGSDDDGGDDAWLGASAADLASPLRRRAPLLMPATRRITDAAAPLFRRLAALTPCAIDATLAPALTYDEVATHASGETIEFLLGVGTPARTLKPVSKSDANLARSILGRVDARTFAESSLHKEAAAFVFMAAAVISDKERAEAQRLVRAMRLVAGVSDEQARALALQYERARRICNHCSGGVCDKTGEPSWCADVARPACANGKLRARAARPPQPVGQTRIGDDARIGAAAAAAAASGAADTYAVSAMLGYVELETHAMMRDAARAARVPFYDVDAASSSSRLDNVVAHGLHAGIHGESKAYAESAEMRGDFESLQLTIAEFERALPTKKIEEFMRAHQALVDSLAGWLESKEGSSARNTLAAAQKKRAAAAKKRAAAGV